MLLASHISDITVFTQRMTITICLGGGDSPNQLTPRRNIEGKVQSLNIRLAVLTIFKFRIMI